MRKNCGFTLIEMIVVLVIIGIVAGVAVPRFSGSFDSIKFKKTMSDLVIFLREARIKAMTTSKKTSVVFDLHGGFCWNEDKRMINLPSKVEMFSDQDEDFDDETKTFLFYPNGTAKEEKLGFVFGKLTAVLHVEPLGGLAFYKYGEPMEQVIRYERDTDLTPEEQTEKVIDNLKDSVTFDHSEDEYDEEEDNDEDEYDDNY